MQKPGYRDAATCQENHNRFVRRVVETEIVWTLSNQTGVAQVESNEDDDDNPSDVLLFWSDEAYARRTKQLTHPEYDPSTIPLFDFLYRWLPGMSRDKVEAATNWTGDLVGFEHDPYELRLEIEASLNPEQANRSRLKYSELTRQTGS
jgi:hypothetical protein